MKVHWELLRFGYFLQTLSLTGKDLYVSLQPVKSIIKKTRKTTNQQDKNVNSCK